ARRVARLARRWAHAVVVPERTGTVLRLAGRRADGRAGRARTVVAQQQVGPNPPGSVRLFGFWAGVRHRSRRPALPHDQRRRWQRAAEPRRRAELAGRTEAARANQLTFSPPPAPSLCKNRRFLSF